MSTLLQTFLNTDRYNQLEEIQRARIIYILGALLFVLGLTFLFFPSGTDNQNNLEVVLTDRNAFIATLFFFVMIVVSHFLTRSGRRVPGGIFLFLVWTISFGLGSSLQGLYNYNAGIVLALIPLLAGLVIGMRGVLPAFIISLILVMIGIAQRQVVPAPPVENALASVLSSFNGLLLVSGVAALYLFIARTLRAEGERSATEDRLKLAEITTLITRRASVRGSLNEVVNYALELLLKNYPSLYHAQIFLLSDDGSRAELIASTGEVGQRLLTQGHGLGVGSVSVIGQVTLKGEAIIAQAGSQDGVHRRNEFLPDTRLEAAFPLQIGDKIIGALDLQSKIDHAVTSSDLPTFQALADSIALTIDNVRQFERAESRIQDNQRLVEQTRSALRQVERLNERLIGRAWSDYLNTNPNLTGIEIDFDEHRVEHAAPLSESLSKAISTNTPIQEKHPERQVVAVPLRVRGQIIGAMEFELDTQKPMGKQEIELIQEIGERFGLAAENTRLLQESQHLAQREALVNTVGARLQSSNSVSSTLMEAARSLQEILKTNRIVIKLREDDPETPLSEKDSSRGSR